MNSKNGRKVKAPLKNASPTPAPPRAVSDEHVPELFFNSLWSLQAGIASAATSRPYIETRQIFALSEEERQRLNAAAVNLMNKHSEFFTNNRDIVELLAGVTGGTAAMMDKAEAMMAEAAAEVNKEPRAYTKHEALSIGVLILAPLAVIAIVLIWKHFHGRVT
jgi:hypothetical protein